ncbi:molybdenum cofactor biosynthesis protein MoaE [soil metagenome]
MVPSAAPRPPIGPLVRSWVDITEAVLPVAVANDWVVVPSCGAVVTFTGTARDHSTDRPDVELLEYEAYTTHAVPRLQAVADAAHERWPVVGRVALLHRVGPVALGEAAVVVAVAAPHRDEAFTAARYCIDTLKATVPIWKRERWAGGESWGLAVQPPDGQHLTDAGGSRR